MIISFMACLMVIVSCGFSFRGQEHVPLYTCHQIVKVLLTDLLPYFTSNLSNFAAGNLASKFAASELYGELMRRLPNLENVLTTSKSDGEGSSGDEQYSWKEDIRINVTQAFEYVHDQFLDRITTMTSPIVEVGTAPNMDQSGTTATAILVTDNMIIAATLGDSRAVISSSSTAKSDENSDPSRSSSSHSNKNPWKDFPSVSAVQFSIDHVASHPTERDLVIERGGFVSASGGIPRVNGIVRLNRKKYISRVCNRMCHVYYKIIHLNLTLLHCFFYYFISNTMQYTACSYP
jgi:hypothetical protein